MNMKYRIGDRVRISPDCGHKANHKGTVLTNLYNENPMKVLLDDGDIWWFNESDMKFDLEWYRDKRLEEIGI